VKGLLVIGAAHGAAERETGSALAAGLRRAGEQPVEVGAVALGSGAGNSGAVHGHTATASPVTAARHEGASIDPAALAAAVRDAAGDGPAVVTAAGGLLAPLTTRYSVRDLAAALGLPIVLAVPAGPDAVNVARLSVESARGAGMAVAAVVLTGWPDPPDRVLLDERGLLDELSPAPVLTLPGAPAAREDAVRRWPVAEWLAGPAEVTPAPQPVAVAPAVKPAEIVLEPYTAWEPRPVGDPRATPRPRLMAVMLEIIAAEGPMRASRAYALYNRASGGKKLTSIARAPLSSAVYWLARENKIVLTRSDEIPWQEDDLVRTPDTPPVHVRAIGSRTLEEVPLDEIAELMRRIRAAHGVSDAAGLKRAVLGAYSLVRLTTRADEYLGLALDLME
jgi:AAA domain